MGEIYIGNALNFGKPGDKIVVAILNRPHLIAEAASHINSPIVTVTIDERGTAKVFCASSPQLARQETGEFFLSSTQDKPEETKSGNIAIFFSEFRTDGSYRVYLGGDRAVPVEVFPKGLDYDPRRKNEFANYSILNFLTTKNKALLNSWQIIYYDAFNEDVNFESSNDLIFFVNADRAFERPYNEVYSLPANDLRGGFGFFYGGVSFLQYIKSELDELGYFWIVFDSRLKDFSIETDTELPCLPQRKLDFEQYGLSRICNQEKTLAISVLAGNPDVNFLVTKTDVYSFTESSRVYLEDRSELYFLIYSAGVNEKGHPCCNWIGDTIYRVELTAADLFSPATDLPAYGTQRFTLPVTAYKITVVDGFAHIEKFQLKEEVSVLPFVKPERNVTDYLILSAKYTPK